MLRQFPMQKLRDISLPVHTIKWDDRSYEYVDLSSVDREKHEITDIATITRNSAPSRARQMIQTGDVLFGTTRPLLKRVCVVPDKYNGSIASTGFSVIRPQDIVSPLWIYYNLLSERFYNYIEPLQMGATYPAVSDKQVMKFEIPIPPIVEQKKIVHELALLESIISRKNTQLEVLKELELSCFYDSFGNPVYNTKGWKTLPLVDVTTLITDGSHYSPKDDEMGTIPMLTVKNMGYYSFDYKDCKMISQEEYKKLEAAGCKPMLNDVLVAKDGSYFKKIFVHQSEAPQAILSSIAIVRPDQTIVTPEFLCALLSTPDIYNLVEERYLTGTAIKRVILKGLRQLKVILPPLEMQQVFSKKVWRIAATRHLIEESLVESQKLFDSRMNYYFGD